MTVRIDVIFCCPRCGLIYQATQERVPIKRGGRIECMKCNAEIHRWSGEYDFVVWRPLSERAPSRPESLNLGRRRLLGRKDLVERGFLGL
jgi:hypothetical protein